jgi:hypothetical protein
VLSLAAFDSESCGRTVIHHLKSGINPALDELGLQLLEPLPGVPRPVDGLMRHD